MLFGAHVAGLILTAAVSAVVARWVRRQTDDRAGTVMIVILFAHVAMATLVAAQLLVSGPAWKSFFATLWYLLILVLPVVWLVFAIYFTGREYWLTPGVWALLLACVAVPAALWLTNPLHGLLVERFVVEPDPFPHLVIVETSAYVTLQTLVHVNVFVAFGLLLRMFLVSWRTTRLPVLALLVGMVAVFVPAVASTTEYVPVTDFPYGVFGAAVFGVLVAVSLFRTRMFAVAPLARDSLFESLGDAVIVVDDRTRLVDYNDAALDLFPDLGAHVGERLEDAYPDAVERIRDSAADAASGDAAPAIPASEFAETARFSHGDRTLRVDVTEITSGGEPRGYGVILRDVTELEAYASELEQKTEKLERFASVLSHDLRNPVSIALGYVELEREQRDSEYLEEAEAAIHRIDETIDDLLTLSREGEVIDDPEIVSLSAIAADAWSTSATGDTTLEIDVDDEFLLRADPSRLRTMLENLFRNAAEHGGETVRVKSMEGGFVVADDGPGVPASKRDQIFEYGHSSSEGGTGFGLAIVCSIAEAHEWSVSLAEGESGGARFEVTGVSIG